jgi:hypothetical protein
MRYWIFLSLCCLSFTYQQKEGLHVIELEPTDTLELYNASPYLVGVEKVADVAEREGASVAINAGFFLGAKQKGSPAGIFKMNDVLMTTPVKSRCAFGFNGTTYLIDRLSYEASFSIDGISYPLDGLNTRRTDDQSLLFTKYFSPSTLTPPEGKEYLIEETGHIIQSAGGANSLIPRDGYVYSMGKNVKQTLPSTYTNLSLNVSLIPLHHPENYAAWNKMPHILGGTPLLIMDGKINSNLRAEKILESFIVKKHERSAVAIKKDGTLFFAVTTKDLSLAKLAEKLLLLGAEQAMNLDGGSSSTLYVHGEVINRNFTIPVGNIFLIKK